MVFWILLLGVMLIWGLSYVISNIGTLLGIESEEELEKKKREQAIKEAQKKRQEEIISQIKHIVPTARITSDDLTYPILTLQLIEWDYMGVTLSINYNGKKPHPTQSEVVVECLKNMMVEEQKHNAALEQKAELEDYWAKRNQATR